jgi:acyl-CoA hydrolase
MNERTEEEGVKKRGRKRECTTATTRFEVCVAVEDNKQRAVEKGDAESQREMRSHEAACPYRAGTPGALPKAD